MIQNPYPTPVEDDDKGTCRFQTYLSGEDKGLLFGIRPIRGTAQAVINNLIRNLCNDLRELNITTYHPDADSILAVLIERRPLSADQLSRIRRTLTSTHKQVSTGLQQHSGSTSLREGLTSDASSTNDAPFKVVRGKPHNSKTKSKTKGNKKTVS